MLNLQENPLYNQIQKASGFGIKVDESSDKNWSLLKSINNRQNCGSFLRNERCKINNLYLPNSCERSLVHLESKVFCGSFTRDGDNFVTGSQDQVTNYFEIIHDGRR